MNISRPKKSQDSISINSKAKSILVVSCEVSHSMKRYSKMLVDVWNEIGFQVVTCSPQPIFSRLPFPRWMQTWFTSVEKHVLFPLKLRRSIQAFDYVHFADHADAILCCFIPPTKTIIVTVHDLLAIRAALGEIEIRKPGAADCLLERLTLRGLYRANYLIAVSRSTSREIEHIMGRKAYVILNPVDPTQKEPVGIRRHKNEYLLVVSSNGWRKRREFAIQAWLKLRKTKEFLGVELIIVGVGPNEAEIATLSQVSTNWYWFMEDVDQETLTDLYKYSSAVLQLSLYEGFGWPIVESQFMEKPVLCSDTPTFREVGGDGAVYIGDSLTDIDWDCVATSLKNLETSGKPYRNALRFDWSGFVQGIQELSDSIISQPANN